MNRKYRWERPVGYALLVLALVIAIMGVVTVVKADAATGSCRPAWVRSYHSPVTTFGTATTWIYGDSITAQSAPWLNASEVAIDGYSGRTTEQGIEALIHMMQAGRHRPGTIIMALGTNDYVSTAVFQAQVRRALKVIPKKIRIIWINIYSESGNPVVRWNNLFLQHFKRIQILDWNYANYTARVNGKSPYVHDGIHVNPLGCEVRNQMIREAVR